MSAEQAQWHSLRLSGRAGRLPYTVATWRTP